MNATLTCNPGDGVGGATVQAYQWIKGGVALQDGGRVSGSAQATLRITSAILEDQGSYMCGVTNVEGVAAVSGPSQLNITASTLNIITTQTSLSIVFGQTGRLNCSAVGGVDTLPLTLTWSTTANVSISRVVRQQSVAMVADTLTLPSVNTSYRGVYTCVVSDAIRRVQSSILVNVTVPPSSPSVTISPSGPVSVGINATLTCNPGDSVGGATVQGYKWIKGGVALLDGGRVSGSAQATLKITPAILEDQGSYMCSVTNVEGVAAISGPSQLNITGPLFTTSLNPSTSLKATSQMTLVCVANNSPGSPNLVASWSYPQPPGDTRVLVSMTTYVNGTLRTSLSVTNVSSGDNGVYMCSFTNGALKGSINSSTLVSVLYPPQIVSFRSLSTTTVITAPSSIALQCEVSPLVSLPISFVITHTTSNGNSMQVFAVSNTTSLKVNYTSGPSQVGNSGVHRCNTSSYVGSDSRELQITVKDKPQLVDVSTISHQSLSLSTILITWGQPPNNNDIITKYTVMVCPSSSPNGPCLTSVTVDVRSPSALITSYTPNQTYVTSIRAFNGVGGSNTSLYYFRSPGKELAAPTNVEAVFPFNGGVLVTWRLPYLGDPSLHPTVTVANFTLCYSTLRNATCSLVSFDDVFYAKRPVLGCVLSGVLPGVPYNVTVTTGYLVPAVLSTPTSVQIVPIALRSPDYHVFQNLTGQFVALLTWGGLLSPSALAFVDSYVVSYSLLSKDGFSYGDFVNFTASTTSALFNVKLNAKYSVSVFARLNTLSGFQLAPFVKQGFTVDTAAEVGSSDASSQTSSDRNVITAMAVVVVAVIIIFFVVIGVLSLRLCLRPKPAAKLAASHQVSSMALPIPLTDCAAYTTTMHLKATPATYETPVPSPSSLPNDADPLYQYVYERVGFSN